MIGLFQRGLFSPANCCRFRSALFLFLFLMQPEIAARRHSFVGEATGLVYFCYVLLLFYKKLQKKRKNSLV